MNTGQTMLTIVAMMLLSTVILTVNRGFLTTNTTMSENRIDILGVSLANSIIEDATSLAFDENTVSASITSTASLTPSASLGIDNSESASNPKSFDDFDDYNCYKSTPKLDTINVPGSSASIFFRTYCRVDYVNGNSPDNVSTSPTFHKRLSIKLFSPGMTDTIRLSTIYSYWYLE